MLSSRTHSKDKIYTLNCGWFWNINKRCAECKKKKKKKSKTKEEEKEKETKDWK